MPPRIGPINAALPTPLLPDQRLDETSARRLFAHCRRINLDGVFVLGSMGEGSLLTDRARERLVAIAHEELSGKITVLAGASDSSAVRMHERAVRYGALGADYVIFTIPLNVSIDRGIDELHKIASASMLPCGYYEVPAVTGRALSFSQLQRLVAHPNIHVFKDSSNNALHAQGIAAGLLRSANVTILDGVEFRTAFSASLGYDGVLHGGGAMTARRVRRIWELALVGNYREAIELDRINSLFLAAVYDRFLTSARATIGQKSVLKLLQVCDHETVILDQTLDGEARTRIEAALKSHHDELFGQGFHSALADTRPVR